MKSYIISFRILKKGEEHLVSTISGALGITRSEAVGLINKASKQPDIKIKVTAEQLGDLQASRIIHSVTDNIRYLCDVEEIPEEVANKIIEMRPKLRSNYTSTEYL